MLSTSDWKNKWVPSSLLLGGLALLISFSVHLASTRIYQVDECCNIRGAYLVASAPTVDHDGIDLFQRLLALVIHGAQRSVDLFASGRFLMVEIFWLNLVLLTLATGESLFSRRGCLAGLMAATLVPLWDYGFEIRHDNLLLTCLLLMWYVLRVRPTGLQSYALAGCAAAAAVFLATKAPVYVLPLSAAALLAPPDGHQAPRWKLTAAWLGGALLTCGVIYCFQRSTGSSQAHLEGLRNVSTMAVGSLRFAPWETLARLFSQTPLLLALTAAALWSLGGALRRQGIQAISWQSDVPEALLFLGALAVLFINPTPYPYNLINLVPFAFLLAYRHAAKVWKNQQSPALAPLFATLVLFGHLAPFAVATARHLDWKNSRQEGLMRLAEDLTDERKDPVFDGTGMVPTRPVISEQSFLHGTTVHKLLGEVGPHLRDMLAKNPAAVIIPNGRTDWLQNADLDYIHQHYVTVSDDFLVLGQVLGKGGGSFEILRPGRYRISTLAGSCLDGTYSAGWRGLYTTVEEEGPLTNGELDGRSLSAQIIELQPGPHHLVCKGDEQAAVVWIGPRQDRIHRFGKGDHTKVFVNWY